MKQKDIALIAVIIIISAAVSIAVSRFVIAKPTDRQQKVEVVEPITAGFEDPDPRYFNSESIDPTKLISIEENANQNPFNGTSQ